MKGRYVSSHTRKNGKRVKAHWRKSGGGYERFHSAAFKPQSVKKVKRASVTV